MRWSHHQYIYQSGHVLISPQTELSTSTTSIYYELLGNSSPSARKLLLISGHGMSSRAFATTLNYLLPYNSVSSRSILRRRRGCSSTSINTSDYNVCVFDNRGVGESTQLFTGTFTIKDMALDALQLLQHLGWSENVTIIGLSMGGMIAQQMCLNNINQRLISCLILVSTTFQRPLFPKLRTVWRYVGVLIGWNRLQTEHDVFHWFADINFPQEWLDQGTTSSVYEEYPTNRDAIFAVRMIIIRVSCGLLIISYSVDVKGEVSRKDSTKVSCPLQASLGGHEPSCHS